MKSLAAVITAPRTFEFREQELPPLGEHDLLVKIDSMGLCHSDLPRYTGKAAIALSPEGYRESRPAAFPCMVGHEPVGTVLETGSAVTRFRAGDKISGHMPTCFRTHLVIPESSMVFRLPENLRGDYRCCVAEPLGCIVNVLNTALEEEPGRVAVVGCGHLGLLTISGLRGLGVQNVTAVDLDGGKLELAKKYGATAFINPAVTDARKAAHGLTGGNFYDTVMEITGSIKGLQTACSIIKFAHANGLQNAAYQGRGRILSSSVYSGEEPFPFGLAHDMMLRTPIIHAVHPSSAPDVLANDIKGAELYNSGVLPLDDMISHTCAFSELSTGFGWLESPPEGYIKGLVLFD